MLEQPEPPRWIRARRAFGSLETVPTARELVYDTYNFFVIGFDTTERPPTALFPCLERAATLARRTQWRGAREGES
jgi:hypothetical protein